MSDTRFFSYFDNIVLNDIAIKNIFRQFLISDIYLNDSTVFKTTYIVDGDTPESLALKIYGNTRYFWIILLSNNIKDYLYNWPMTDNELRSYTQKYVDANESLIVILPGETEADARDRVIEENFRIFHTENENKRSIKYLNPKRLNDFLYIMDNKIK